MTARTHSEFLFAAPHDRPVVADFSGPATTSKGGALLPRQTATKLNPLRRLAACIPVHRDPR
ncbi:MAG: hypothetical protein INH43_28015 [Acidobacteriaceae bacterium]|jgi:hypothetical protein|nr:hypothetical protein [Acidobacteriaceae bacterium]